MNKHYNMYIRLIESKDYLSFFNLIERNRQRLLNYFPLTVEQITDEKSAKRFINLKIDQADHDELYCFLIFEKDGHVVGTVTAKNFDWKVPKCELAYYIDFNYEGQGYGTKALKFIVKYCFETLELEKVFLRIAADNIRSKHLALKNAFVLEGIHIKDFRTGTGDLVDVEYYALFK